MTQLGPRPARRAAAALALWGLVAGPSLLSSGCRQTPVILQGGTVRVTFSGEETCGFDSPHVADAKGCRRIDDNALMCRGFGVIDGVLFAGGCEAPATVEVLDVTGTMPVPSEPPASEDADSSEG